MAGRRAPPRIRRSPEEARENILDAADRVFAESLPDAVGLREIAAAAAVSHGLVTHYFGTYEALVDAALARRLAALRDAAFVHLGSASFAAGQAPLVELLLDVHEDRALVRLIAWAALKGTLGSVAGPGKLGLVVDAMVARLTALGVPVDRSRIEFSVLAAISMVLGWSIANGGIERMLGRVPLSRAELREHLQRMIVAYVAPAPLK